MSTRERWIVYPLLFLAIGLGLRNKLFPPSHFGGRSETVIKAAEIDAKRIRCGDFQTDRALIGQTKCRELIVFGPSGRPAIIAATDGRSQNGMLETFAADGRPLVQLRSTEAGGVVVTFGSNGRIVVFGDTGQPKTDRKADKPLESEQPTESEQPEKSAENQEQ